MFDVFFQVKYGHFPSEPRRWRGKPWEPRSAGLTVGGGADVGSVGGWEVRLGGGAGDSTEQQQQRELGNQAKPGF